MGTTNRPDQRPHTAPAPTSNAGEISAPVRSLTAVVLAIGLYGLLVVMTVVYQLSLGG